MSDVKNKQDQTKAVNFELSPSKGPSSTLRTAEPTNAGLLSVAEGAAYLDPSLNSFPLLTLTRFGGDMSAQELTHSGEIDVAVSAHQIPHDCSAHPSEGELNDTCTQAYENTGKLTAKVLKVHVR